MLYGKSITIQASTQHMQKELNYQINLLKELETYVSKREAFNLTDAYSQSFLSGMKFIIKKVEQYNG